MIVVSRSVHIGVAVSHVFELMADPAARSRLNPAIDVIRIEIEGGARLCLGASCHFRLQAGRRILDYRTRVVAFEPGRRIVSVSDTAVPFEVAIEVAAERDGTRLVHTERFEPTEAMLRESLPNDARSRLVRLAYHVALFVDADWARRLRRAQEEMVEAALGVRLERWLAAVKAHLEPPPKRASEVA